MGQIFVNDTDFVRFYPMTLKSEAGNKLADLIQDVGIPRAIHVDGSKEQNAGKWNKICADYQIKQSTTEAHSPWQNRAESAIKELKKNVLRIMQRTGTPKRLWDFAS